MRNRAVTMLLFLGITVLLVLSIINLVISKTRNDNIDRLIATKVSQALQSPGFQSSIDNSVQDSVSKIRVSETIKDNTGLSVIGPQGPSGRDGSEGMNGKGGSDGKDGKNGKSAYDIWLSQGNTGTEQDFLDHLVGPQGNQGIPGEALQLQWSASGTLQQKYSGDDIWIDVMKVLP